MQAQSKNSHARRRRLTLPALILCLALLGAAVLCLRVIAVDTFDLSEYSRYCIEAEERSSAVVIDGRNDAAAYAKKLWRDLYETDETLFCKVSHDLQSDCWLVTGMSPDTWYGQWSMIYGVCGGIYHAILSSDGQVLAAWVER